MKKTKQVSLLIKLYQDLFKGKVKTLHGFKVFESYPGNTDIYEEETKRSLELIKEQEEQGAVWDYKLERTK